MGGLALIMMLIAARTWRRRGPDRGGRGIPTGRLPDLPDGLLRPAGARNRAGQGRRRRQMVAGHDLPREFRRALRDVGAGAAADAAGRAVDGARRRPSFVRPMPAPNYGRLARAVQSPPAVVAFVLVSGLLQALYWIRQGGDFMHARVLLAPLFCLLAPVVGHPRGDPDRLTGTRLLAGDGLLAGRCRRRALAGRSRAGRCGRRTRRAWAMTPPASPTPASSTSAASMRRPPGMPTR